MGVTIRDTGDANEKHHQIGQVTVVWGKNYNNNPAMLMYEFFILLEYWF